MTSRTANEIAGAELFFKCESFQRAGAFKFRGAYNALVQLTDEEKRKGVLTFSSGNHAAALALAGKLLGVHVVIIMPSDAPGIKVAATKGYGGEVVLYDRSETTREKLGQEMAEGRQLKIIHPYDHQHIVAGAGTAAKELFGEVGSLDFLVVPCGGGGLLSGSAISAGALSPGCEVIGVEPQAGDDGKRSFESGVLQAVHNPDTIADGARTPSLGPLVTFPVIQQHVSQFLTVSDEELLGTTRFLWERMKIVVEPTGALAVAACLLRKFDIKGRVGVMISGGNADVVGLPQMWTMWPAYAPK
jgi:threo-3-hydroxy-L-aspartate ammonia-lyase